MAYGWGDSSEVLDFATDKNMYCDIEGPIPSDMSGDPFVKLLPLLIPVDLAKNNTFWIDLNRGVRALYFPARYQYSKDFPGDAAYTKISFVEDNATRNLIDASTLMFENSVGKWLSNSPIDLKGITRETAETIHLNRAYHIGAYSFDSSLIINVPQFIESSFFVAADPDRARPHDSIYLAKSADIKARRIPWTAGREQFLPLEYHKWEAVTQRLLLTYSGELARSDQVNLQETQSSDIGAGTEFGVNLLLMAVSLVPHIGPVVATIGSVVLENMKNLKTDSSAQEAEAAGISSKVWEASPVKPRISL